MLRTGPSVTHQMHSKAGIFDAGLPGQVMLIGTCNWTHNGFENNLEHVMMNYEAECSGEMMENFEGDWLVASPVTDEDIQVMWERQKRRDARYLLERRTRNSKSVPRKQHRRILESDLEEAGASRQSD